MKTSVAKRKALMMCHGGAKSIEKMVAFARERGLDPVALTSACPDGGVAWRAMCEQLDVPFAIARGALIGLDDVDALLERVPGDYAFAYAYWDGQRELMATLNQRFGAPDLAPAAVKAVQDKLTFRQNLVKLGLSKLDVWPADSAQARAAVAAGKPLIVKPRRGAGSLMTGLVRQSAELERLVTLFKNGMAADDIFSEYAHNNELIAEGFFEGVEFSFEILRSHGKNAFWCVHEKTRMDFLDVTILERGFSSPCVTIDEAESRVALAIIERAFDALALQHGCFHVEMLRNAQGEWEFIEINTRIGGAMISDSVHAQYDRYLMGDWMDLMMQGEVRAAISAPLVGTYLQFSYVTGDGRIAAISESQQMRAPDLKRVMARVGSLARSDREEFAAFCLWKTDRQDQAREVAALSVCEFITLEYER